MNNVIPGSIYLLKKETAQTQVLRTLLQFLRATPRAHGNRFSYVEAQSSLHPHLSLWENLQIESGSASWKDYQRDLGPEQLALVQLLKDPLAPAREALEWEKFIVSFLKAAANSSHHLLVDLNEAQLSPFLLQTLKANFLGLSQTKTIVLATATPAHWSDCAHTLVEVQGHQFRQSDLKTTATKRSA